jgi:hypothetical protein
MKRRVAVYSFLLGVFISSLSCLRGANAQERALLQGEIVDLPCYMVTGGRGADYQACALLCARKGVPIGIVTDAGELFLLLTESNNPEPYEAARQLAGQRAELTGRLVSKHGVASLIVESAEGR